MLRPNRNEALYSMTLCRVWMQANMSNPDSRPSKRCHRQKSIESHSMPTNRITKCMRLDTKWDFVESIFSHEWLLCEEDRRFSSLIQFSIIFSFFVVVRGMSVWSSDAKSRQHHARTGLKANTYLWSVLITAFGGRTEVSHTRHWSSTDYLCVSRQQSREFSFNYELRTATALVQGKINSHTLCVALDLKPNSNLFLFTDRIIWQRNLLVIGIARQFALQSNR